MQCCNQSCLSDEALVAQGLEAGKRIAREAGLIRAAESLSSLSDGLPGAIATLASTGEQALHAIERAAGGIESGVSSGISELKEGVVSGVVSTVSEAIIALQTAVASGNSSVLEALRDMLNNSAPESGKEPLSIKVLSGKKVQITPSEGTSVVAVESRSVAPIPTSYSVVSAFIPSACSASNTLAGQPIQNCFDGQSGTFWSSSSVNSVLTLPIQEGASLDGLRFRSREVYSNASPKTVVISGRRVDGSVIQLHSSSRGAWPANLVAEYDYLFDERVVSEGANRIAELLVNLRDGEGSYAGPIGISEISAIAPALSDAEVSELVRIRGIWAPDGVVVDKDGVFVQNATTHDREYRVSVI